MAPRARNRWLSRVRARYPEIDRPRRLYFWVLAVRSQPPTPSTHLSLSTLHTPLTPPASPAPQARTLLFGFFVLSWLRAPAPALSPPSAARLASALGLPLSLAQSIADASPPTPAVAATAAIPSSASASSLPRAAPPPASFRTAAADPAAALRSLASDYATERQYLQRLRLFKLSMLWRQSDSSVPGGGLGGIPGRGLGRAAGGLAPSKVLAAWRVLRSDDPKAASAALEVLETTLAPRLAALVLPLVNDAVPLERKLRVSAAAGRPEQGAYAGRLRIEEPSGA